MDQDTRTDIRKATRRRRRPPGKPLRIRLQAGGTGEIEEDLAPGPIELTVEVTGAEGELATWFNDDWWTTLIERWGDDPLTMHIAPTPTALLHSVTLHQLEMVRRVVPRWRVVGHAHADDVSTDEDIRLVAGSPYDEVRFFDGPGSDGAQSTPCPSRRPIEELLGRIRREQARLGVTRPILVRLPSTAPAASRGRRKGDITDFVDQ